MIKDQLIIITVHVVINVVLTVCSLQAPITATARIGAWSLS